MEVFFAHKYDIIKKNNTAHLRIFNDTKGILISLTVVLTNLDVFFTNLDVF